MYASLSLLQNYCGAALLWCRSLENSTYTPVRLVLSLAYAVQIALLMTFYMRLGLTVNSYT